MRTREEIEERFAKRWKKKLDWTGKMSPDIGSAIMLDDIRGLLLDIRDLLTNK